MGHKIVIGTIATHESPTQVSVDVQDNPNKHWPVRATVIIPLSSPKRWVVTRYLNSLVTKGKARRSLIDCYRYRRGPGYEVDTVFFQHEKDAVMCYLRLHGSH